MAPETVLRALTFDYWDTLYAGASSPERISLRQEALRHLLAAYGRSVPDDEFATLYRESAREADRWWREEHRGYVTADRIRWFLDRLGVAPPDGCQHLAAACRAVDETLLEHPPPLLPGVADGLRRLATRFRLAIISDTGFASGRAQDRLLERDGLHRYFVTSIYSCDVGHAKPRPEPFAAALRALGTSPDATLHVGDIERTDIRGALGAGLRAVRVDILRESGPSDAERVARSFEELVEYLLGLP